MKKKIASLVVLSCFLLQSAPVWGMNGILGKGTTVEKSKNNMDLQKQGLTEADEAIFKKLPSGEMRAGEFVYAILSEKSLSTDLTKYVSGKSRISLRDDGKSDFYPGSIFRLKNPSVESSSKFSGPLALELAQQGKDVAVHIFADATNVGGMYSLSKNTDPAMTQEEMTVLMAPEIYSRLDKSVGVTAIGKKEGNYAATQKRYAAPGEYKNKAKKGYVNPVYGYILPDVLMTHNAEYRRATKDKGAGVYVEKLAPESIRKAHYVFLAMPSFSVFNEGIDITGNTLLSKDNFLKSDNVAKMSEIVKDNYKVFQHDKIFFSHLKLVKLTDSMSSGRMDSDSQKTLREIYKALLFTPKDRRSALWKEFSSEENENIKFDYLYYNKASDGKIDCSIVAEDNIDGAIARAIACYRLLGFDETTETEKRLHWVIGNFMWPSYCEVSEFFDGQDNMYMGIKSICKKGANREAYRNNKEKTVSNDLPDQIVAAAKRIDKIILEAAEECQSEYEGCIYNKFLRLIRGAEAVGADTLVLGKAGVGVFLNDAEEVASQMGEAMARANFIKQFYIAGIGSSDADEKFVNALNKSLNKELKKRKGKQPWYLTMSPKVEDAKEDVSESFSSDNPFEKGDDTNSNLPPKDVNINPSISIKPGYNKAVKEISSSKVNDLGGVSINTDAFSSGMFGSYNSSSYKGGLSPLGGMTPSSSVRGGGGIEISPEELNKAKNAVFSAICVSHNNSRVFGTLDGVVGKFFSISLDDYFESYEKFVNKGQALSTHDKMLKIDPIKKGIISVLSAAPKGIKVLDFSGWEDKVVYSWVLPDILECLDQHQTDVQVLNIGTGLHIYKKPGASKADIFNIVKKVDLKDNLKKGDGRMLIVTSEEYEAFVREAKDVDRNIITYISLKKHSPNLKLLIVVSSR